MSHFSKMKTKIKDLWILESTCNKLGLNFERGEGMQVRGYSGLSKKADAVVKFDEYDLGFVQQEDGSYEAVADFEYGLQRHEGVNTAKLMDDINQGYACEGIRQRAMSEGYGVEETTEEDGTVVLNVIKA